MRFRNVFIFSGGATLGSVTPLCALSEAVLRAHPQTTCVWMGTWRGVERSVVRHPFLYIPLCNGKLRRYFSLRNIVDPFLILIGFFQSLALLSLLRPRALVSAGSFVAVPLHWAACLLRIPSLAIQPDIAWGLANRLISPCATRTVSLLPHSVPPRAGCLSAHAPLRACIRAIARDESTFRRGAGTAFSLRAGLPTILVMGGGTGARSLNDALVRIAPQLLALANVIHLTGRRKRRSAVPRTGYYVKELMTDDLAMAYAAADIVITRAGMGGLSECAGMSKPVIVVPLPRSAQILNAEFLAARKAAYVVRQTGDFSARILDACRALLNHRSERARLGRNLAAAIPTDDGTSLMQILSALHVFDDTCSRTSS